MLRGAEKSLAAIEIVQLEMSLVPLYAGQILFHDVLRFMVDRGFQLAAIEPGFTDPKTGHTLQVDGVFYRTL